MKRLTMFVVLSALSSTLLYGCCCLTPSVVPRPLSLLKDSFAETRLGDNMFQVAFRGDGRTSEARASEYGLVRSAEVALEHDYRYFIVVDPAKGGNGYRAARPAGTNTIICFRQRPEGAGSVYDARMTADSLQKKYELVRESAEI